MPEPREPTSVDLIWLLGMSHQGYLDRFRGTAVRRAKHWMLQRNAAVALGNTGGPEALPPLRQALESNPEPIVRGHAAWAIGRIGQRDNLDEASQILAQALGHEEDATVIVEIEAALIDCRSKPGR